MPELRKDLISGTWVLFSPERRKRPQFIQAVPEPTLTSQDCPFCEGNEGKTTPEILAQRGADSRADGPGWLFRVIPNKYPALKLEGNLEEPKAELFERLTGVGSHEILIESPAHELGMDELEVKHAQDIFLCLRDRILDLKGDIRFEYIQVFKNQGFLAGATIPHPHLQILALPVAPTEVMGKLRRTRIFYEQHHECYYCHVLKEEKRLKTRILSENYHFVVHAPYASRFPFQLTITPKIHVSRFEESADGVFKDLAEMVKYSLSRINQGLKKPSFHMILNNPPLKVTCGDYFHWTLDILPVISRTGGFELATSCYINPYPPEEVVEALKEE